MTFIPTNGGKTWNIGKDKKAKSHDAISFAGISEKAISYYVISMKSMFNRELKISNVIVNTDTGKVILDSKLTKENEPTLLSNTFFEKDYFVNVGEYFSPDENVLKDESNGIVFSKYDYNGKLISENKTNWNNDIFGKFKKGNDEKNRNHLFFHDVLKTKNGDFYVLAESYRRSASALGIASKALMLAAGGVSVWGATKLTITDAYFIKLDKDYNLIDMNSFSKGKTLASCPVDIGSATINAQYVNVLGGFDYMYTQKNPSENRFYSLFEYKEIVKGGKDIPVVKSVTYNDGVFSEDTIKLKNGKNTSDVYPAKSKHVLLVDHNKKEKTLTLHLEKFNIE